MAIFDYDVSSEPLWEAIDRRCKSKGLGKKPANDGWFRIYDSRDDTPTITVTKLRVIPGSDSAARLELAVSMSKIHFCIALAYMLCPLVLGAVVLYLHVIGLFNRNSTFYLLSAISFVLVIKGLWKFMLFCASVAKQASEITTQLTEFDAPGFSPRQRTPLDGSLIGITKTIFILLMASGAYALFQFSVLGAFCFLVVTAFLANAILIPKRMMVKWRYILYSTSHSWGLTVAPLVMVTFVLLVIYYLLLGIGVAGHAGNPDTLLLDGFFVAHLISDDPIGGERIASHTVLSIPYGSRRMFVTMFWIVLIVIIFPCFMLMAYSIYSIFSTHQSVLSELEHKKRQAFQFPDADRLSRVEKIIFRLAIIPVIVLNWLGVVCAVCCIQYLFGAEWQPISAIQHAIDVYRVMLQASGGIGLLVWALSMAALFLMALPSMVVLAWTVLRLLYLATLALGLKRKRSSFPPRLTEAQKQMNEILAQHGVDPPVLCCALDERPFLYAEPALNRQGCRIVVSSAAVSLLPARPLLALLFHEACHAARHTRIEGRLRLLSLLGLFPNWGLLMFYDFQAFENEADDFAVDCLGDGKALERGILLMTHYQSIHRQQPDSEDKQHWERWIIDTGKWLYALGSGVYGASYPNIAGRIACIRERSAMLAAPSTDE